MNVKWYGNVDGAEVLAVNQRWVATQLLDPADAGSASNDFYMAPTTFRPALSR
jgi:hypothetical protein